MLGGELRIVALVLVASTLLAGTLLLHAPPARADGATYQNLYEASRALLRESEQASRRGDAEEAERKARQALLVVSTADRLAPDRLDVPFLGVLGSILARDVAAADLWLDRFADRNADGRREVDFHYLQGRVRLQLQDRPDLALESFDKMFAVDPAARAEERDLLHFQALSDEARKLDRIENYVGMAKLYQRAVDLARRRGDERMELVASANLGLALQLDNRFVEAADVFTALRSRDPENPYWVWRAGENVANQTRWAEAVPLYEETIRLLESGHGSPPQRAEMLVVHLQLANCHRMLAGMQAAPSARTELLEKARRGFARYIEAAPKDSRGPYWMGVLLHEEMERPYEALPFFERAYALDPVCDASLRNLVQIHRRYPPPPETSKEAWEARATAHEKDLADHAAARAEQRRKRAQGPTKEDGCE